MRAVSRAKAFAARKVVYIEWIDATSQHGWVNIDHDTNLMLIKTIGWLMQEHDDRYVISHSHVEDGGMNSYISIPKNWVKVYYDINIS